MTCLRLDVRIIYACIFDRRPIIAIIISHFFISLLTRYYKNYNIYNARWILNLGGLVLSTYPYSVSSANADGNRVSHVYFIITHQAAGAVQVFCDRLFFIRHCGRTGLGKDLRKLVSRVIFFIRNNDTYAFHSNRDAFLRSRQRYMYGIIITPALDQYICIQHTWSGGLNYGII